MKGEQEVTGGGWAVTASYLSFGTDWPARTLVLIFFAARS
jgi:hypothetical protein